MANDPTTTARDRAAGIRPARRFRLAPLRGPRVLIERGGVAWTHLAATFEREIDAGRGFLWLPVAFGIGILIYFGLPAEPWAPALMALAAVLIVAAWRSRFRTAAFRVLVVAACVACGALAAKVRTDMVSAPVLSREMTVTVSGWIAEREEAARGGVRVLVRVHEIAGVAATATPVLVRVTVRSHGETLAVGDAVTMRARLQPPGGAVMPGGYDFARVAFYERIGAVGFVYGAAKPADIGPAPLGIRLSVPLAHLRDTIRRRVEAALPGDNGHLAAALVMGDRGGISEATQEAMRASGLAHMLAISGLHMVLVAGSAFWLIRALLALSTGLALNRPIKKWAAAGALAVAAAYLGISGAGIATQRAFVMLAIMLVAVMLDRPAITLRNVALAAFVILIVAPESLTTASFQMSFAATVALVAGYEAITAWRDRRLVLDDRSAGGILRGLRRSAGSLLLTSTIAGLATAPIAAFHFQRVAPLTLIANLAAMPVVGHRRHADGVPCCRADAFRAGVVSVDRDGLGARLGHRGRETDRGLVVRPWRHRGDAGPCVGAGRGRVSLAGFVARALAACRAGADPHCHPHRTGGGPAGHFDRRARHHGRGARRRRPPRHRQRQGRELRGGELAEGGRRSTRGGRSDRHAGRRLRSAGLRRAARTG